MHTEARKQKLVALNETRIADGYLNSISAGGVHAIHEEEDEHGSCSGANLVPGWSIGGRRARWR